MTGDANDMLARIKAVLPLHWFPDVTPVLDGVLSGFAAAWAWLYSMLGYAKLQTRIATATDSFLDVIALDFFGDRLARRADESDDTFRVRIQAELLRERGTRPALVAVLTELTGRAPVIFEPTRPADTGAWNEAEGLGWGVAGGWGSLMLPHQCFATAFRPKGAGIATVAGYGTYAGGYGGGSIEYADLFMIQGLVTDIDIENAIAGVLPAATIAWVRITD